MQHKRQQQVAATFPATNYIEQTTMFITTKRFINKFPFDSFTLKRKYKTTKKKMKKKNMENW